MTAPLTARQPGAGRDHTHHQPEEQHVTSADLPKLADAYGHPEVRDTEAGARDFMAQIKLTELRREQHPELTTWSPLDQNEPEQPPAAVLDGDADTWTRNARSRRWRMAGYSAARHEPRAGKALTWQELAYHYGPLTAA